MAKIFVIILILPFLEAAQETPSGTAIVKGMAELKCNFNNPDNLTRDLLTVYWQKSKRSPKKDVVVYAMVNGKEEIKHIDGNYLNNTKVLLPNNDLRLYNTSLKQSGTYRCIVHKKNDWHNKIHDSKFNLDVLANFSVPKISSESSLVELERGSTVSLKCSSGHGFPRPQKMFWELITGNGTKEPRCPPHHVENTSETFDISISLTLRVEEDINVTCVLEAHHKAVSPVLQLRVKKTPVLPNSDQKITISIVISVIILVSILALSIILSCKQTNQCRSRVTRSRDQEMGPPGAESKNTVSPENCTLMSTEHEAKTG